MSLLDHSQFSCLLTTAGGDNIQTTVTLRCGSANSCTYTESQKQVAWFLIRAWSNVDQLQNSFIPDCQGNHLCITIDVFNIINTTPTALLRCYHHRNFTHTVVINEFYAKPHKTRYHRNTFSAVVLSADVWKPHSTPSKATHVPTFTRVKCKTLVNNERYRWEIPTMNVRWSLSWSVVSKAVIPC